MNADIYAALKQYYGYDSFRPGQEQARSRAYLPQLQAYSQALEQVLGRRVRRRVLWFFATGTAVEV